MSKHTLKKLGFLTVLALAALACGGSSPPADASGQEIYVQVCAVCHGADLSGGTGPRLAGEGARSADKPESYFVQSIASGIGRMPAMRGTLTEDQIERVARYVMEQQGR